MPEHGRSKSGEQRSGAQNDPAGRQDDRRPQASQPHIAHHGGASTSRDARSPPTGVKTDSRAPPASEKRPSRAGGARDEVARNPPQKTAKKFDEMKKHLSDPKASSYRSLNNQTQALVIEALEADAEAAKQRSSSERKDLGQKVRFNFQMTPFALRPKNRGHHSTVMDTLVSRPAAESTRFFAPEFGGPWFLSHQPRWTLAEYKKPDSGLGESNEELFHLTSPRYAPMTYPSWRENIRAAWLAINAHYEIESSRTLTSSNSITITNLPNLDGTQDPFSLKDMQHIAQAIIHFEDALQTLLPKAPQQRRNWRDNLALKHKSRLDAIAAIGQQRNTYDLLALFCSQARLGWCWYFYENEEVIWVQTGASDKADAVIEKLEHLLPFIEACLTLESPEQLQPYYPDLAGLKSFLLNSLVFRPLSRSTKGKGKGKGKWMQGREDKRLQSQPCSIPEVSNSGPRRKYEEFL